MGAQVMTGRHRATAPGYSVRGSLRTVLPVWAAFTALRWLVAMSVSHVFTSADAFAGTSGLHSAVATWDAGLLLVIADEGYPLDHNPLFAAFLPGFPLAERALGLPLSLVADRQLALMVAGVILTTACSLGAAFLLHRIAYEQYGRVAAGWAVVLLMAWPSAAFLTALYSESLYLVAALGAWLLATRQRWVMAGLVAGLATLTRVNGIFLVAALLVMYVTTVLRGRERFQWRNLAGVLLGGWGVAAFFTFLLVQTGDLMAWSHAQEAGWGRQTVTPWSSLQLTWTMMTNAAETMDKRWQMEADMAIVLVWVALAVVMAVRRYWSELTLTVLTLGSIVTSSSYLSVTRLTLTVFPLTVVGGSLLARVGPRVRAAVVGASTAWMVTVMGAFALGYWAG